MRLRRLYARRHGMLGDCDRCGHSIIYHYPLIGCAKCSCGEFTACPSGTQEK